MIPLVATLTIGLAASAGLACELPPYVTPEQARAASLPVDVSASCEATNVGVWDLVSLASAEDLGNGRVVQRINNGKRAALVTDCSGPDAVVLRGRVSYSDDEEDSCGPIPTFHDVIGAEAGFDLTDGRDLDALVEIAMVHGARRETPHEAFFTFTIEGAPEFPDRYDVPAEDRFDVFCGCMPFYPNSPGATR